MAGLKITLVNSVKPIAGSGDGITEYTYNIYMQLSKQNTVVPVYSISNSIKNDVTGLLKVNLDLRSRAKAAVTANPDVVHITNQEVGFAAAATKASNPDIPVVTTIHDISRFEKGLHRGLLQRAYNAMVRRSVTQAIKLSDFLLFDSSQTKMDVKKMFDIGRHSVVNIGIDKKYSVAAKRKQRRPFTVGYIGSFAYHKNVIMLMKAAKESKGMGIRFSIYGLGNEYETLKDYRIHNELQWVSLNGFAPENRKVEIYDSFDVFVFPSLYEGFGLPILEAQSRGLPVIIYKNCRISKEVRKYCLEARDEQHMADMIYGIKENGYDRRLQKQAASYARSFTWEKCAIETMHAYKKLL